MSSELHRPPPCRRRSAQVVIFYFNGTFMQRSNGAHSRAEACLNFLLGHFERVIVYSFRNHPTCPWTDELSRRFAQQYPRAELVLDERPRGLVAMTRLKNVAAALAPGWAARILALRLPGMAPGYAALLRRYPSSLLIVSYVDGLTQLNGIAGRRFVVETHDLKFVNYRMQTHKPASSLRAVLKFRSEVGLLEQALATIAISPTEASFFRMLIDQEKVLYIPDFGRTAAPEDATPEGEDFLYDLVFVGSENRLNVEGLVDFVEAHRDWLARYRVAVCGKVCGEAPVVRLAERNPGIVLLGFVEDMTDIYRRSKAAVSPVTGTGLKIKIVDALERNKPVFASPTSFSGLPAGYERCVFPIEQGAIRRLLDDPGVRQSAERAAHAYFAEFTKLGDHDRLLTLLRSDEPAQPVPDRVRTLMPSCPGD